MLIDALNEVRGDAGVKRAMGRTCENVDAGIALHRHMKRQGRPRVKPGVTMKRCPLSVGPPIALPACISAASPLCARASVMVIPGGVAELCNHTRRKYMSDQLTLPAEKRERGGKGDA